MPAGDGGDDRSAGAGAFDGRQQPLTPPAIGLEKRKRGAGAEAHRSAVNSHDGRRIERLPEEAETIHVARLHMRRRLSSEAGVDGSERAGRHPIDAKPVGRSIAVGTGRQPHALGRGVAAVVGEPGEDAQIAVGVVPGIVKDAGVLDVLGRRAGIEQASLPGARGCGGRGRVERPMEQTDGQVERVGRQFLTAGNGERAHRRHGGPHVGTRQRQPQRAAAAHRDAGQIDAVLVDGIAPLHLGQHVVDVLFGDALVAHGAARKRAGDDEIHVAKARKAASHGQTDFAGRAEDAEELHEVDAVVGLLGVQADDQRVLLGRVELPGKVEGVRLLRIVHGGMKGGHARTGREGLRHQSGRPEEYCGQDNPLDRRSHRRATFAGRVHVRRGANPQGPIRPGGRALPSMSTPAWLCLRAWRALPAGLPGQFHPPAGS